MSAPPARQEMVLWTVHLLREKGRAPDFIDAAAVEEWCGFDPRPDLTDLVESGDLEQRGSGNSACYLVTDHGVERLKAAGFLRSS